MTLLIWSTDESERGVLVGSAGAAAVVVVSDADALAAALTDPAAIVAVVVCSMADIAIAAALAPRAVLVATASAAASEGALVALSGTAFDILELPLDPALVQPALGRALEQAAAEAKATAAEQELQERRRELAADLVGLDKQVQQRPRTERLRAELSAAVVAELATCIAPVPALLQRAAVEVGETPAGSAVIDSLFAAEAAGRMVSDLHDVVRAERALLPLAPESLQTTPFVESVLACVARVASDYEAAIDLSGHEEPVAFRADPRLLQRALENMLECGLRRSRKGRLRFAVSCVEDSIRFDVIDSGGAVPDRLLPALFTRLARLEGGTIQRGAALGFCRAVAEAIGGSVYAAAEGAGLRLTLAVPRAARDLAA